MNVRKFLMKLKKAKEIFISILMRSMENILVMQVSAIS